MIYNIELQTHNDFTTLSKHSFKIVSDINFDDVVELMNKRFFGLPFFHQSIHLEVKKVEQTYNINYINEGGLNVEVLLKDINHFYSKYLHYFNGFILLKILFNNYLKNIFM